MLSIWYEKLNELFKVSCVVERVVGLIWPFFSKSVIDFLNLWMAHQNCTGSVSYWYFVFQLSEQHFCSFKSVCCRKGEWISKKNHDLKNEIMLACVLAWLQYSLPCTTYFIYRQYPWLQCLLGLVHLIVFWKIKLSIPARSVNPMWSEMCNVTILQKKLGLHFWLIYSINVIYWNQH